MTKVDPWASAREAQTLLQAHTALSRLQPAPSSEPSVLRDYYLRSASVYALVAEIDREHHHEALYWANREREKAAQISGAAKA